MTAAPDDPFVDPRPRRRWRLRVIAVGAVVLLVALAAAALWRATRYPAVSGEQAVAGIDGPIEILRGTYGIPHIFATTPRDAYFGLGFCEAQDRTFQLEIFRRAASGTLAEALGEGVLDLDRFARTVGFRRIAERQIANAPPEALALAQAFCDGINEGNRSLRWLPPDMAAAGVAPGRWEPIDCMALARLLSWGLAEGARSSALFARLAARLGPERALLLLPPVPEAPPLDRADAPPVPAPGGLLAAGERLAERFLPRPACSSWVVGASRAAAGAPIFAYDSHQGGARIPGEVYLAHLVGGDRLDVAGGMLVGLPGVYAGATREIAFAPTNLGGQAQDLIEVDLDTTAVMARVERIAVRGRAEPVALEIRETAYGPLVAEAVGLPAAAAGSRRAFALRWAGARPELRLDGYVTMPLARTWEEFRACLAAFEGAAQHYAFASAGGTIAYQVTGPLPRRAAAPPPWPRRAAEVPVEPEPLLTLDELPHLVRPRDDFIATANHRPHRADRPHYLGRAFVPPARHDRLVELLEASGPGATRASLEAAGQDLVSTFARRAAPALAAALSAARTEDARWVGARLRGWDHRLAAEALEPLLFHGLVRETARAALEDDLGDLLVPWASAQELAEERLGAIFADPASPFWDDVRTPAVESRGEVVERAALASLALLEEKLGRERSSWRWDRLHRVVFESYLHDVTGALDLGPFGVPGDDATPFRFGHRILTDPFKVEVVTLMRMVADLGDPSAIWVSASTGASGWPWHPHWKDQVPLFLEGERVRLPRNRDEIRATCEKRLVLAPRER